MIGLLLLAQGGLQAADAPVYSVSIVGPFYSHSWARDINASGQIVGRTQPMSSYQGPVRVYNSAVRFENSDALILGWGPDHVNTSEAFAINDAGQAVGWTPTIPGSISVTAAIFERAPDGTRKTIPLGWPSGYRSSHAYGINNAGHVVGQCSPTFGTSRRAFVWKDANNNQVSDPGEMQTLGVLPGGDKSLARGINMSGQVVGWSEIKQDQSYPQRAFLYDSAGMHDLGTLPGQYRSEAYAINDAGQVVGGSGRPFLWENGVMRELGVLDARGGGTAYDINNLGQVVGTAQVVLPNGWGADRAFLYTGGRMLDLNKRLANRFPGVLTEAHAINEGGQIVGWGLVDGSTAPRAFLLTPTDAPVVSLAPEILNFPLQAPGADSAPRSILVTNDGNQPLTIQSVTLGGANAADFEVVADSGETTLQPGASRAIFVRFRSSVGGKRTTSLTISDSALSSPHVVQISGEIATPRLSINVDGISFGEQPAGSVHSIPIVLKNVGTAALTFSGGRLTGANAGDFFFYPGLAGVVLAPGQSKEVNVGFKLTGPGSRTAVLMVGSDAPGSPHPVPLSVVGTAPALTFAYNGSADGTGIDFGSQVVGSPGTTQTLTLKNTGTAPLAVGSITITGPQAGEFAIAVDTGAASLAPGAIRALIIRFTSGGVGNRGATLSVTDNAAGSPHSMSLAGTGIVVPLKAPTPLRATKVSLTQVDLTWEDNSANESEFVLLRRTGAGLYARIAVLPPNTTSYVDTRVAPNTTYSYILRAYNAVSGSPWSNEAGVTTPLPPPPAAPTPLRATVGSPTQVNLIWQDNSSTETQFVLLRKTGAGLYARIAVLPPNTTSYADSRVAPNTTYSYILRAYNAGGGSPWSNETSVSTPLPPPLAAPTPLRATVASPTQVNLTWQDNSSTETQFVLLRRIGAGLYQRIAVLGVNTTHYNDTTVSPGVTYTYIMRAVNEAGVSAWTNELSVSPP